MTHINYIREKDKSSVIIEDLHRQNGELKSDNQRLSLYSSENTLLSKENRNLKDLLLESSL